MNLFKCISKSSVVLMLVFLPFTLNAGDTEEELLKKLVVAVLSNDYEFFIADGTEQFKKGITKKQFAGVADQFKHLNSEGYSTEYLTTLKQKGLTAYIWKLTHQDSEDEMLARLVLSNNKVAGFWIQ